MRGGRKGKGGVGSGKYRTSQRSTSFSTLALMFVTRCTVKRTCLWKTKRYVPRMYELYMYRIEN